MAVIQQVLEQGLGYLCYIRVDPQDPIDAGLESRHQQNGPAFRHYGSGGVAENLVNGMLDVYNRAEAPDILTYDHLGPIADAYQRDWASRGQSPFEAA